MLKAVARVGLRPQRGQQGPAGQGVQVPLRHLRLAILVGDDLALFGDADAPGHGARGLAENRREG
ncbi:hypothetical protein D3C80_945960 [compost metagenome]